MTLKTQKGLYGCCSDHSSLFYYERRCGSQRSPRDMPKQPASFVRWGSHQGRCLSWLPNQCCQFHNWSLKFTFLHITIDAVEPAKTMVQMLLCFQRNPLPGLLYSTWESSQAVAELLVQKKLHNLIIWISLIIWILEGKVFISKDLRKNLKEE